ncbi:MAG: hypothetical protein HQK49_21010 [Oligoflexia bacterium]|nr:hypothetical protein [Oligoflexia bacterium]
MKMLIKLNLLFIFFSLLALNFSTAEALADTTGASKIVSKKNVKKIIRESETCQEYLSSLRSELYEIAKQCNTKSFNGLYNEGSPAIGTPLKRIPKFKPPGKHIPLICENLFHQFNPAYATFDYLFTVAGTAGLAGIYDLIAFGYNKGIRKGILPLLHEIKVGAIQTTNFCINAKNVLDESYREVYKKRADYINNNISELIQIIELFQDVQKYINQEIENNSNNCQLANTSFNSRFTSVLLDKVYSKVSNSKYYKNNFNKLIEDLHFLSNHPQIISKKVSMLDSVDNLIKALNNGLVAHAIDDINKSKNN